MTQYNYDSDNDVFEWNPSIECMHCGGAILARSHTFPDSNSRPFYTYRCDTCTDSGTWGGLARTRKVGSGR